MKKLIIFLFLLTLLGCNTASKSVNPAELKETLTIKFGLLEKTGDRYQVYKETTEIPFITMDKDPDYSWGFTIETADRFDHDFYKIVYLPKPAKEIEGSIAKAGHSPGKLIYKSNPSKIRPDGVNWFLHKFHESDPKGNWKIEIYIDNVLITSIDFTVS